MNKLLPLSFKDSREYLHGSDFFNKLMDLGAEITGNADSYVERLKFRQYATKLCEVTDIKPIAQEKVIGLVRYVNAADNSKINLWIIETDSPILARYPFDETVVLKEVNLEQEERSIILPER